jgi:hypothetical protein
MQDRLAPPPPDECRSLFGRSHLVPYHDIAAGTTIFVVIVCPKCKIRICEWFDAASGANSVYSFICLHLPARQFHETADNTFNFLLYRHPQPGDPGGDKRCSVETWDYFHSLVARANSEEIWYRHAAYLNPTRTLQEQIKNGGRLILHLIVPPQFWFPDGM